LLLCKCVGGFTDPTLYLNIMIDWISPHPHGIYLPTADCWIDPSRAVAKALVTHGHADHARGGHGSVWATAETLAIMDLRYGEAVTSIPMAYGAAVEVGGGITASWHPAGHVLGSAQILLQRAGERVVVTGDYKRRADPTCAPFKPVSCDVLVTEATFGLPVFVHPPIANEMAKILDALAANPERCILIGAYALGKAQRVIAELRLAGHRDTIYLHGAMVRMCQLYTEHGVDLGSLAPVVDVPKEALKGAVIIAPPSALNDRWSRRLPDPITAMASGWMRIRQRAVQRNVELPLIISDHCDWVELTDTIRELAPSETWITHGREEALLHWCEMHQIKARALELVGREEEEE
jgi:putative mRNA 3-end processing factor